MRLYNYYIRFEFEGCKGYECGKLLLDEPDFSRAEEFINFLKARDDICSLWYTADFKDDAPKSRRSRTSLSVIRLNGECTPLVDA